MAKYLDETGLTHFWGNVKERLAAVNVAPLLAYEGIITAASVSTSTYEPAASVSVAEDCILQIFVNKNDNTQDGIYKFISVGEGQSNKVLATGSIPLCGHANSAFVADSVLYVLYDDTTITTYTVDADTHTVAYDTQITIDVSDVGLIFCDEDGSLYCGVIPTLASGEKNISLYSLEVSGTSATATLMKSNILPSNVAVTLPPLRNDCFYADGCLYVAITNATGNLSYNAVFVYDMENDIYCCINIPEACFAFSLGEIEGLAYDEHRQAIYMTCKPNNANHKLNCVIVGFCPFVNMRKKASYLACVPNTTQPMAKVRYGTLAETSSICQTGNSSTPATNLALAVAFLHYQTHVLLNEDCYIELTENMTETLNRLPDGDYHLSLNSKTLTVKSASQGYVELPHGKNYINGGTINTNGDTLNVGRESVVSMYNVNMSNGTIYGGRGIAILSNVTNVTINTQSPGNSGLTFVSGSTPSPS